MGTQDIAAHVAAIPAFPIPGILFRDITPVLMHPKAFEETIALLAQAALALPGGPPDVVVGMESRGFIFGAPLALRLGAGFVPIRKPGKLPRATVKAQYAKEYGNDALEMHADALAGHPRVVIVDDLLATGGTAAAARELVKTAGGRVLGAVFVIELDGLKGRDKLPGLQVQSLLHY